MRWWILGLTLQAVVGCSTQTHNAHRGLDLTERMEGDKLVITGPPGTLCFVRGRADGPSHRLELDLSRDRQERWTCYKQIHRKDEAVWETAYRSCVRDAAGARPALISCEAQRVRDGLVAARRVPEAEARAMKALTTHAFDFAVGHRDFGGEWTDDPAAGPIRLIGSELVPLLTRAVDDGELGTPSSAERLGLAVTLVAELGDADVEVPWLEGRLKADGNSIALTRGLLRFGNTTGVADLIQTLTANPPGTAPYNAAAETFCHAVGAPTAERSLDARPLTHAEWTAWWDAHRERPAGEWQLPRCTHYH